ncbi:hypothetical protein EMPS_08184 [Entomortierella parvispora]|uniref:Uncharacterized protein n=1 Tax=Entomortierella parvispora TaxID=205924 RepID=A0A9P3HFV4_9FUNG|nr:hypothetical protein EMPS_08184 [Entomortierella parvispora]
MVAVTAEVFKTTTSLPFTPAELGDFHRFHAYDWDNDTDFQAGLKTIAEAKTIEPSFSELLKMKQYYFSTRQDVRINLDDYLSWRKHIEQPSDDPNVPIFKRFDEYDFDNDVKFQQGLPSFIGQLLKDGKNTMDKATLQKEITKAKAFYYARFVELFDFPAYVIWKEMEKSLAAPACPYAHLWQNKGKGSGSELAEDSKKFLTSTYPVSAGAAQVHIHSPATRNKLTGVRLAKISEAITGASEKEAITSIYWTVNTGKSTQTERDPESQIVTKDEKWFSGGLVVKDPKDLESTTTMGSAASTELLQQYYSLVKQVTDFSTEPQRPVVVVVDGIVSLSSAYLAFGTGAQRVITENATLSFTPLQELDDTPNQLKNPFAGLYLLSKVQSRALSDTSPRSLPRGVGHYLAFCPDYILRGPDLRKLGLADFFVSSAKLKDIEESVLSIAGCPPPHTVKAIRMALNAEIVYPGPAKIDVWRMEIQACFGDAKSVDEIVTNLEKYNNNWSKSIRGYIANLEPLLAKLLFEGIKRASEASTFEDVVRIESRLTRRYHDYMSQSQENKEALESMDDLSKFFEPLEDEKDLLRFPFAEWIKEHGEDDEAEELASATGAQEPAQDPAQACPYLAGKQGQSAVPTDHPNIPGVDFSDPEAIKSCPFLSSKAEADAQETLAVPADHPVIPGVDFNDPEAVKACPFLSAKREETPAVPADHPAIPGVDFSNPEAMKACPFLSSQAPQSEAQ